VSVKILASVLCSIKCNKNRNVFVGKGMSCNRGVFGVNIIFVGKGMSCNRVVFGVNIINAILITCMHMFTYLFHT
jgi:hypothetical protein